jgi:ABC-type glutathione transport system ATPase component
LIGFSMPQEEEILLELRDTRKYFPLKSAFNRQIGWIKAVDGVSLLLKKGETLGLVGESGCGKSTLAKTIIGIYRSTGGEIVFRGQQIAGLAEKQWRRLRKDMQYVYQDPGSALDPRWKVRESLHEPLIIHTRQSQSERNEQIRQVLRAVGLKEEHLDYFPHEMSGGQQRRVGLARILTLQPSLVVLDEPTSGLDVSVQATILKLLLRLQHEFDLTYLFISHDLAVVRKMCQRVAVMYLGRVVEVGDPAALFDQPRHPQRRVLAAGRPSQSGADSLGLPVPDALPAGGGTVRAGRSGAAGYRVRPPRGLPQGLSARG